jgi:hypothetical protein
MNIVRVGLKFYFIFFNLKFNPIPSEFMALFNIFILKKLFQILIKIFSKMSINLLLKSKILINQKISKEIVLKILYKEFEKNCFQIQIFKFLD